MFAVSQNTVSETVVPSPEREAESGNAVGSKGCRSAAFRHPSLPRRE